MPRIFFVNNDSGTMADALKVAGLAEVLRGALLALPNRDASPIAILDHGDHFTIELPSSLEEEDVALLRPFMAGHGVILQKEARKSGEKSSEEEEEAEAPADTTTLPGFPYERQRQMRDEYFKQRKNLSPADQKRLDQHPDEFAEIQAPNPDLPLYISVNHFKAANAYNGLLKQWIGASVEEFQQTFRVLVNMFSQLPNDLESAAKAWTEATGHKEGMTTRLQVVNPSTGKGSNATKASGISVGGLNGFWLTEYLKFVGYFTVADPIMIRGEKDRKTYVLHPTRVDVETLDTLMREFRATFRANSSVKSDILASLHFTQLFVQYRARVLRENAGGDPLWRMFGRQPRITDISTGFDMAFYKDMGSAYATMNQATINFPDWLQEVNTEVEAQQQGELLDEHIKVVQSIRTSKGDEGSDEFALLKQYRDFLSGHDIVRFFDFAAHFGDYTLAHMHRNQWARQFTTQGMETLVSQSTNKDKLTPIITNEGFKAIAKAIRQATVLAQYHAARKNPGGSSYPFEVRYGLGQDLLRSAAYPETFIARLSEFLHAFNAENARMDERMQKGSLRALPQNRRANVRTSAIDDIVALVDAHGSEVVCKLLVAYGYARDPRAQGEDPQAASEPDDAAEQMDTDQ